MGRRMKTHISAIPFIRRRRVLPFRGVLLITKIERTGAPNSSSRSRHRSSIKGRGCGIRSEVHRASERQRFRRSLSRMAPHSEAFFRTMARQYARLSESRIAPHSAAFPLDLARQKARSSASRMAPHSLEASRTSARQRLRRSRSRMDPHSAGFFPTTARQYARLSESRIEPHSAGFPRSLARQRARSSESRIAPQLAEARGVPKSPTARMKASVVTKVLRISSP